MDIKEPCEREKHGNVEGVLILGRTLENMLDEHGQCLVVRSTTDAGYLETLFFPGNPNEG